MDSKTQPKVSFEIPTLFRAYEDGTIDRFVGTETIPPSLESQIKSKDVMYSPQFNLSSRLYLPICLHEKVPLLLYFHGGGFCLFSAFSPILYTFLTTLAEQANVLIVAVDYRIAPENPLPAAYDDAWTALNWVASHSKGDGPEEWVNRYADLGRVYFAGDSAGGNIAHNLAMRLGVEKLKLKSGDVNVVGIVLVHPYFWGKEAIDGEFEDSNARYMSDGLWNLAYPNSVLGLDDPLINPCLDPNLSKLGCKKVLVFVAEKDQFGMRSRNWLYYESLNKSGWQGVAEIMEAKDETHCFHIAKPTCDNAVALMKKFVSFLNQSS
ncbi:alpha/beta-Hydrolases superfamily protein [Euphorbia peplus]|nr:alpha/beta-Hydrolases superfamily protein [Euphorbia peplus]